MLIYLIGAKHACGAKCKCKCVCFITWFVVAVMMLIGSVKIKAIALAKRSPHHGIWTWLFKKMQRIREIASVTRSNALNHHKGMSLYFLISLV